MKIQIDTHTHSVASLHAYSTIDELARSAKKRRLTGFVLTDHGPSLQNGFPHPYYFGNLRVLPRKLHGVFLYRGVELNILDTNGSVDLKTAYIRPLDFVMAGLHEAPFPPKDVETNTKAIIAALENPLVDGISHPGNSAFPADYEAIVKAAYKNGKTLEINNSTFKVRKASAPNCLKIAQLCKQYGALITCGSDAHYCGDVGNFTAALAVIKEAGISADQVVNSSMERWLKFTGKRQQVRAGAVLNRTANKF